MSTFEYWLYRKSKAVQLESKARQRFLPVEALPSPALEARAAGHRPSPGDGAVEVELVGQG